MPTPLFKKGSTPYKDFLDTLTPEERKAHFAERTQKGRDNKIIKDAWKETIEAQKERWLALFNNRALELLENGNGQDYAIVFDRIVGKPTDKIEQDIDQTIDIKVGFKKKK